MSKCWSCLFFVTTWMCLNTNSASGACTPGTYGLDCSYTCHCSTNCNDVTGCFGSCQRGWSGLKCNNENIALGKLTSQSSHYSTWIKSSRAVDGSLKTVFTQNSCIHTALGYPFTWWQVDLGSEFYIHKLAIYFRTEGTRHRNGVKVYSSVDVNQTNTGHLCGLATLDSSDVTWMTCDDTARYITLYRDIYGDTVMDLCEVQVFVCAAGTFGDDCTTFCHCRNGSCNYVTGECTGGCKQNWTGQKCSECESNHYGPLCGKPCSSRHCDESRGKSSCNKTTGRCDNGCTAGWKEPDCTKECRDNTFGSNCLFSCNERHCKGDNSSCDVQHGVCQDGCQPGWTNANCIKKCDESSYGPGCVFKCNKRHCQNKAASCNHVDGSCGGECENNYNGTDCTECDVGQYGPECNSSCSARHCKGNDGSCDHVTGLCGETCEAGWQGDDCSLTVTGPEDNRDSIIIALAVVAAILFMLLIIGAVWHFRSRNSQRNNVARPFISPTSHDRTEAEPSGLDSGSGYVNAAQTNEYEELDVLNSSQNDYDKITGI